MKSWVGLLLLAVLALPATPSARQVEEHRPDFIIYEWSGGSGARNFVANPSSVAFDSNGEIYVLDAGNHRIAVFSSDGLFLREFGREGEGPGEFVFGRSYYSSDIAVDRDRVFVVDSRLRRIHIFDREGELLDTSTVSLPMNSMAVSGDLIYLTITGFHPERSADILVQDRSDETTPRFTAFAQPIIPPDESPITRLNRSQIAVGRGGRLMQAYFWWPVLRLHLPGATAESFLGKEWWIDERHDAEQIPRLRDALAGAKKGRMPPEQTRFPFVLDIEYVAIDDSWVTLVNGNTIHFFGDGRQLTRHLKLLTYEGGEPPSFGDIGISSTGEWLCAADATAESFVACYRLSSP